MSVREPEGQGRGLSSERPSGKHTGEHTQSSKAQARGGEGKVESRANLFSVRKMIKV